MSKVYHKIDGLFKRNENTKELIIGDFRNPCIKILKDITWEFTEKIDGTNIRIIWDGFSVTIGGRTDNAQIPSKLLNYLSSKFLGKENEELFEQKFPSIGANEIEVILYGEGFGKGIQKTGQYYRPDNEQRFILFDVQINGIWLDRKDVGDIAQYFNIPIVPILIVGTINDGIDCIKTQPKSHLAYDNLIIEGLVGRPTYEMQDKIGKRIICKIKCEDFKKEINND